MIERVFEISLRQRIFVLLATICLMGLGLWSSLRLPIDAVPDITNIQVQLNAYIPSLSPEEIEEQVSLPLEMEMAGIEGLEEVRSLSKFGLSQVTLIFKEGTDVYRARQLVSERLAAVELPDGTIPRLAPISTGLGEICFYQVESQQSFTKKPPSRFEQLLELRAIPDWVVKPAQKSVPGIADIETAGGFEKQIVIEPDPEKLTKTGLTFDEFAGVISENVEN